MKHTIRTIAADIGSAGGHIRQPEPRFNTDPPRISEHGKGLVVIDRPTILTRHDVAIRVIYGHGAKYASNDWFSSTGAAINGLPRVT